VFLLRSDARPHRCPGKALGWRHILVTRAAKLAPSIPFAYADWGETLLRETITMAQ